MFGGFIPKGLKGILFRIALLGLALLVHKTEQEKSR